MKYLLPILLFLLLPATALADGGELVIKGAVPGSRIVTNYSVESAELTYTPVQTLPYTFSLYDYNQPTLVPDLGLDFTEVAFVDVLGSVAITVMAIVSEYALLSAIVIMIIALFATIWLFTVVVNRRIDANISASLADLPTDTQLFELADNRTEYDSLVSGRNAEATKRRGAVLNTRLGRFKSPFKKRAREFYKINRGFRRGRRL